MRAQFLMTILVLIVALSAQVSSSEAQGGASITPRTAVQLFQVDALDQRTITAWAWSDDGQVLAIGLAQEIRVYWSGQPDPLIIGGQNGVHILAMRPDKQVLASSDRSGLVRLWDLRTGDALGVWGTERVGRVSDLYFFPEAAILAINFLDLQELVAGKILGTGIRLWEYTTAHDPEMISTGVNPGEGSMAVNADHSLVATSMTASQMGSGSPIAIIRIRDTSTGERLQEMGLLGAYIARLVFSPTDPDVLVSLDEHGVVRVWDAAQGVERLALTLPRGRVSAVAFSPNGSLLATGGSDHTVRIWRVTDGALIESLTDQPWPIQELRFTATGAVYGFSDPAFIGQAWDARTRAAIASHNIPESATSAPHEMGHKHKAFGTVFMTNYPGEKIAVGGIS